MNKLCKNCHHWQQIGNPPKSGVCKEIGNEETYHNPLWTRVYPYPDRGGPVEIITGADFGCIHFSNDEYSEEEVSNGN